MRPSSSRTKATDAPDACVMPSRVIVIESPAGVVTDSTPVFCPMTKAVPSSTVRRKRVGL